MVTLTHCFKRTGCSFYNSYSTTTTTGCPYDRTTSTSEPNQCNTTCSRWGEEDDTVWTQNTSPAPKEEEEIFPIPSIAEIFPVKFKEPEKPLLKPQTFLQIKRKHPSFFQLTVRRRRDFSRN